MRPGLPVLGLLALLAMLPIFTAGASSDESGLRTVALAEAWHMPGPLIALLVAVVGTVVVEVARRVVRAARATPRPQA